MDNQFQNLLSLNSSIKLIGVAPRTFYRCVVLPIDVRFCTCRCIGYRAGDGCNKGRIVKCQRIDFSTSRTSLEGCPGHLNFSVPTF